MHFYILLYILLYMPAYYEHGFNLSQGQAEKIYNACKKKEGVTVRLSKSDLNGNFKIPITQTQLKHVKNATNTEGSTSSGMDLKLSVAQLKHMEKTGRLLPLAAVIP